MNNTQNQDTGNTTLLWILLLGVLTAELFVFTWSRIQCLDAGYAITRNTSEYNHQIALRKKLRIELAHLKSPDRIATIAKDKMGLMTPQPNQILTIR